MSGQLLLSLDLPKTDQPDLTDFDRVVIGNSGGKDSQRMLGYVADLAAAAGVLDRVVVVHNDLGVTDTGRPVEWPGTRTLARLQSEAYGLRFEVVHREINGLYQQARQERHAFPSSSARWCTSDQKTSQAMKLVTRLVAEAGVTGRPARVLYCLGLRAEESPARARKAAVAVDGRSNSVRTITRWHPIHQMTEAEVWEGIHASGVPYHPAYGWGMSRLSCSLCVLSSWDDLVLAARLRPALVRDYLTLEREFAEQPNQKLAAIANFRSDFSMADVAAAARNAGPLGFACPRPDCTPVPIIDDVHDPFDPPPCPAHPGEFRTRLAAA
ncbi:phosphoadenosine phosphosulfate reductase family protein [Actinomadura yumaensis]|uniref:Phosphoadenosine phosphosulfate reductase family protein n=1 Tax=Actinomadura yumaensis TaxID=111807 RepID=A0ABW2CRC1_9ACTN